METDSTTRKAIDARENARVRLAQGTLAVVFTITGAMKLALPMEKLTELMTWPGSVAEPLVRAIGIAELAGAIGLVVPMLSGIRPGLASYAAFGLMALMIGALGYHLMLFQGIMLVPTLLLGLLAAYVGVRRMR